MIASTSRIMGLALLVGLEGSISQLLAPVLCRADELGGIKTKLQPPAYEAHVFAGLLYIKHGRVGTRSEGPDYYLQCYRTDYLLDFKKRHLWERDEALEALSRQFVAIRGTLNGDRIRVESIQQIKSLRVLRPPLESLVEGNSEFAFKLLQRLATSGIRDATDNREKSPYLNLAVSPYSISTTLAMTAAGAQGETATEMAKALELPGLEPTLLHDAYGDLQAVLNRNPRANFFTIKGVNRLWAERNVLSTVVPQFREITSRDYGAEIEPLNFAADPEGSRGTINRWVAEQTHDRIREVIPAGGVDARTRLVLSNALYFQGYWQYPFDKQSTQPAAFHLSSEVAVKVPTMQQRATLPYLADADWQVVSLPVRGEAFSMLFVLPGEKQTLADVRSRLTGRSLTQLVRRLTPQQLELHLPKFIVKSSFELGSTLSAMGMPKVFSARDADLSGINGKKNLYISKVFHEAFVDVNEAGIEAAAATAAVLKLKSLPPKKATLVKLDRPFLFALLDNRTGSFLFLGQVINPER